jgi:membrane-associated phospholipid phosphatase
MIASRTSAAAGLSRRHAPARAGSLFLALILIAAPAWTQELPTIAAGAGHLSLPQIDWASMASDDEAFAFAPAGVPDVSTQQPAAHPEPAHTGFKALLFETGSDFKAFPRRPSTWVILGIGGAAAAIAHPADGKVNARLAGSKAVGRFFAPGKYLGAAYVQAGTAVGLYVIGRYMLPHVEGEPRTNKVSHLGFDLLRSLIVSQALTQGIKITVRRDRPTGECCAFPSGHSSAAFATASVLERHLGYRGAWPTFLVAAYVATSRLHDNRHFLSDVLFGSALGVATGWTVVGLHGRSNYAVMPVPVRGGVMVSLTRKLRSQAPR